MPAAIAVDSSPTGQSNSSDESTASLRSGVFRIEPDEIERIAEQYPAVERAIVTSHFAGTPGARLDLHVVTSKARRTAPAFSLFFFASASSRSERGYQLFLEAARFADRHGFAAVWTPERHFHDVGGPTRTRRSRVRRSRITEHVHFAPAASCCRFTRRSGSPRNGRWSTTCPRVVLGWPFASGWHPHDFVFRPDGSPTPRSDAGSRSRPAPVLARSSRWRPTGEDGSRRDACSRDPQSELPLWLTASGSVDDVRDGGPLGVNVLTHLLGQDVNELAGKIALYRAAREQAG